jgi:glutamate synthase (ferredoxin)
MTGGRVLVLGPTGRNFAAGMSGGIAYVLDEAQDFRRHCNPEMVELETLVDEEEIAEVRGMIERHAEYTGSDVATKLLTSWDVAVTRIVRVMPRDYRRVLEAIEHAEQDGLTGDDAIMHAFEANKSDLARVSGN